MGAGYRSPWEYMKGLVLHLDLDPTTHPYRPVWLLSLLLLIGSWIIMLVTGYSGFLMAAAITGTLYDPFVCLLIWWLDRE